MNTRLLAQEIHIGTEGATVIKGPLSGINNLSDLVNKVLVFIVPFAAIILFFVLVWGGFDFLMSQGNPEKIKSGRMKIITGLIGFFILVFSIAIVRLLGFIFGLGDSSPL